MKLQIKVVGQKFAVSAIVFEGGDPMVDVKTSGSEAKFVDLEKADSELYDYLASLTIEERFENFCRLLKSIYGESINTPRRLGGVAEVIDFPKD